MIPRLRLAAAAVACAGLLAVGVPGAGAAPASDAQGYADSTARCAPPSTAVVFGSTAASRVAICEAPGGEYQYRGVRVSDGARLILPAAQGADGSFAADNEGVTYTVTPSSLVVTQGSRVLRREAMVDFHGPESSSAPSTSGTPAATQAPAPSSAVTPTPTPATPLPPPLPAEVGGAAG